MKFLYALLFICLTLGAKAQTTKTDTIDYKALIGNYYNCYQITEAGITTVQKHHRTLFVTNREDLVFFYKLNAYNKEVAITTEWLKPYGEKILGRGATVLRLNKTTNTIQLNIVYAIGVKGKKPEAKTDTIILKILKWTKHQVILQDNSSKKRIYYFKFYKQLTK